ncbi:hypothetical protein D3C87_1794650 [compost metagenome]
MLGGVGNSGRITVARYDLIDAHAVRDHLVFQLCGALSNIHIGIHAVDHQRIFDHAHVRLDHAHDRVAVIFLQNRVVVKRKPGHGNLLAGRGVVLQTKVVH